jgi:hypothetical protein
MAPRLIAELRRRPKAPKTASYELVAEMPVAESVTSAAGYLMLKAEHYLGIVDNAYRYMWLVKRASDGSHFERRRVFSFTIQPDPDNRRASDAAKDWPCKAVYQLHLSHEQLNRYIDDSRYFRDLVTRDFVQEHPDQ